VFRDVIGMWLSRPPEPVRHRDRDPARRFAIAETPFERLREVKNVLGGTINDVVLSAVAGGLHRTPRSRAVNPRRAERSA
jgi:hypothetical protein